jgi:O-antigen/teichoic acid export membrane protein
MITALKNFLKKPILKEISWYTVGQIGTQVFAFFGVMVTARYLGPINLGLYSFVQNYLGAFMTILGSIELYFTWKIAKSSDKISYLKESFGYKLYLTSFVSISGIILAWIILPHDIAVLTTVLFSPLILGSTSSFYSYAVATKQATLIAILQITAAVLLFVTKVTLVHFNAPLIAFVATNAAEGVFMVVIITSYFFTQKDIRDAFAAFTLPTFRQTLVFMYSIKTNIALLVLWQLIVRADQLAVATFANAYSLGIYAAAVRIAEVPNVFSGILYTALISRVVFFGKEGEEGALHSFRKVFFIYLFSGLFFTIFIIVTAPLLVHILYGEKFMEAVPVLRAYALSIPGSFILTHSFSVYGVREQSGRQVVIFAGGVTLNVVLIYILSPFFGLVGAALATSLAYTLLACIFFVTSK